MSKLHLEASLFDSPLPYGAAGRPLEPGVHVPGGPGPPPLGDYPGMEPADGAPGHPLPARAVLRRGVALRALPAKARVGRIDWPGKGSVTFSDALCAVRLRLWSEGVFREAGIGSGREKLPASLRELLCRALAPAA